MPFVYIIMNTSWSSSIPFFLLTTVKTIWSRNIPFFGHNNENNEVLVTILWLELFLIENLDDVLVTFEQCFFLFLVWMHKHPDCLHS